MVNSVVTNPLVELLLVRNTDTTGVDSSMGPTMGKLASFKTFAETASVAGGVPEYCPDDLGIGHGGPTGLVGLGLNLWLFA